MTNPKKYHKSESGKQHLPNSGKSGDTVITELLLKLRIAWSKDRCKNETTAKGWLQTVAIASVGVTAIILGVREFKGLQSWELSTYDQMLRLRPPEAPDPRILLVTITEDDIQREKWPLSDSTINRLLAKLQSDQPRVIGLNIYRPQQKNLAKGVRRTDNIISICAFSSMGNSEIAPPPNFPIGNVGFSDLISDDDRIVRRSLLFANAHKDKKCQTSLSFASLLATKYLEKQGIKPHFINKQNFQLGKTFFRRLTESSSSYEHLDAKGYQILLNYHDRPSVRQKSLIQKSKVQKRYKPLDCRASLATLRDLFMENEKYVFREECNQVILRPYYKPRPPRIANGASRFIYGVLTFDF